LRKFFFFILENYLFNYFSASIFPVCFRDDPQLANCLIRTIKVLQSRMTTGDLGNGFRIPILDPLYIPKYAKTNKKQRVLENSK